MDLTIAREAQVATGKPVVRLVHIWAAEAAEAVVVPGTQTGGMATAVVAVRSLHLLA